jgi:hypothetical protein
LLANSIDQPIHVQADPPHLRASPLPHLNGVAA